MHNPTRIRIATLAVVALAAATVSLARGEGVAQAESRAPARPVASKAAAVAFLSGVIRRLAANDYATAYATLVPVQQRLVSRAEYVACESQSPVPGRLTRLRAIEVRAERVRVPGASGAAVRSVAVAFELRIEGEGAAQAPVKVRLTAHALRAGGALAWMLPAARLRLHASGSCSAPTSVGDPTAAL